jgi:hypothetical protein
VAGVETHKGCEILALLGGLIVASLLVSEKVSPAGEELIGMSLVKDVVVISRQGRGEWLVIEFMSKALGAREAGEVCPQVEDVVVARVPRDE